MEKKDKITRMTQLTAGGLHVREAAEGEKESRTITGYAILFDTPSAQMWSHYEDEEVYEKISRSAITKELLDKCDIKMTMFHDRQLILARSNEGEGTLTYNVDEKGVSFSFDAPHTADGDKALELVRRGDIAGCSFAFTTHYYDRKYVSVSTEKRDGKTIITYSVDVITGIYDFTLAADPAYPDTTCEAEMREVLREAYKEADEAADKHEDEKKAEDDKKSEDEKEAEDEKKKAEEEAERQKKAAEQIAEARREIGRTRNLSK